jgi:hypothetical protein
MCVTPSFWQRPLQMAEVNCRPLSVVMFEGTPYLETHVEMSASTHVAVSMLRRGTASSHLVDLSMMVRR